MAKHRASYSLFYEELEKTWARAREGLTATDSERADLYLAGTHAVQESAEVVRHLESIAATTVTMRSHPLERIHRDIETLRHHGFVNDLGMRALLKYIGERNWTIPLIKMNFVNPVV